MSLTNGQHQNNNNNDPKNQGGDLHIVTESGDQSIVWRSNQLTYIAQDRHELPAVLATKFGHLATKLDLSYNSLTSFKNINLFTNLNELILDNNDLVDEQLDFRLNLRLKTLSLNKNKLANLYKLINSIKVCYPNLEYLSLIGNPLCPGPMLNYSDDQRHYVTDADGRSLSDSHKSGDIGVDTRLLSDIVSNPTTAMFNGGIKEIDELVLSENRVHRARSQQANGEEAATTSNRFIGNNLQWQEQSVMKRTIANIRDDRLAASDDFSHQKYRHFIIYHLPNLRFLDSSPIGASERDDALRRCFWMNRAKVNGNSLDSGDYQPALGRTSTNDCANSVRFGQELDDHYHHHSRATAVNGNQVFRLAIMTDQHDGQQHQSKGAFSRLAYKYTGKNSEGNRFIRNHDL